MACGRSVVATRDRRPAGVRAAGGRRPRRSARRRRDRPRARDGGGVAAPERGRARGGAPRTTSAVRRSGSRRFSAAGGRSASLTSTSGRICSSSPASRASASACSQLSRTFAGSTPCFRRLSPVTRSFWICSRHRPLPRADVTGKSDGAWPMPQRSGPHRRRPSPLRRGARGDPRRRRAHRGRRARRRRRRGGARCAEKRSPTSC